MARHKRHEDHEEHPSEAWLVAFADMMTLLMVTFLMMFAISSLDLQKFKTFQEAFEEGLGKNTHALPAQGAPADGTPRDVPPGTTTGTPTVSPSPVPAQTGPVPSQVPAGGTVKASPVASVAPGASGHPSPAPTSSSSAAPKELKADDLAKLKAQLEAAVGKAGLTSDVQVALDPRGLVLYVTSGVLFDQGKADLTPEGQTLLDGLTPALAGITNDLVIEGHTDSRPISTAEFPSNWELSTSRATAVLRHLEDLDHLASTRLSAAGYADTRPRDPGTTAAALAKNRRVDIVVLAPSGGAASAAPTPAPSSGTAGH